MEDFFKRNQEFQQKHAILEQKYFEVSDKCKKYLDLSEWYQNPIGNIPELVFSEKIKTKIEAQELAEKCLSELIYISKEIQELFDENIDYIYNNLKTIV